MSNDIRVRVSSSVPTSKVYRINKHEGVGIMNIKGLTFTKTCSACPEQYDVYDEHGKLVGYVRLRGGRLTCDYPDVDGELIYSADIGNSWTGAFESSAQRMRYLKDIAKAINKKMYSGK